MKTDLLNSEVIECLCSEYESVWVVDTETRKMELFRADHATSIEDGIAAADGKDYQDASNWYNENCVAEHDKERMFKATAYDNVIEKISDGGRFCVEYDRMKDGKFNYNQLMYSCLGPHEDGVKAFLLGFRDIDLRKNAERDDLTGLYTRQVFFQKAEQLLRDNPDTRYDLLISDIVDFKEINETYGADVGDEILRTTGRIFSSHISDTVLIGRYAGDQFVTLTTPDQFTEDAIMIRNEIIAQLHRDRNLPSVNVKYGIYSDVKHDRPVISACDKAHIALNSIKHQYGVKIAHYDEKIRHEIEVNRKIENAMRKALEERQFKVFYQPKHDSTTGKMVGAEALIRWVHPEYGFMSPGEFIPLFEKNGFVVETDYYVWKRTCDNLRRWQDNGIKTVPISVNASKLTFEREDMIDKMQMFVNENKLRPEELHIEITETMMSRDFESLKTKLNAIRSAGYKIELDDFGSGYSSINILSTFPLDVIKLDISFMEQFGDTSRAKVLAACIKLAKDLGYRTVSEGVELKEQKDVLNTLGVDEIQGYYYSRPLPEEEFEKYMLANA